MTEYAAFTARNEAIVAKKDAEHARVISEVLRLKRNPGDFSDTEKGNVLRDAKRESGLGAERRWFTKRGKNYGAKEHSEVFTPGGDLVGEFGMVRTDVTKRSPAEHLAGKDVGGKSTGAMIFLENGDVVALRRIAAGDPRLPKEILDRQEDARRKGFDPDLSADLQYVELQSSATKRQGIMEQGEARVLPASTFQDMIIVPGFPLQFGEDPTTGTTPRTRENVAKIFSLDERKDILPGSQATARHDRNIDAFRQAAVEALKTGNPAAKLGQGAVKAANISHN